MNDPNEFVRLEVDFELDEDDMTVLRGKKTMRQTVNNSTTMMSSSYEDNYSHGAATQSNKYHFL